METRDIQVSDKASRFLEAVNGKAPAEAFVWLAECAANYARCAEAEAACWEMRESDIVRLEDRGRRERMARVHYPRLTRLAWGLIEWLGNRAQKRSDRAICGRTRKNRSRQRL